jgi:hypothetical protein
LCFDAGEECGGFETEEFRRPAGAVDFAVDGLQSIFNIGFFAEAHAHARSGDVQIRELLNNTEHQNKIYPRLLLFPKVFGLFKKCRPARPQPLGRAERSRIT